MDDAGAVQNSYTYDVYGAPTVTGSLANEFDFAGQQTDGDTGLQYLRARYMDPETGVFLSRDLLGMKPDWLGNPSRFASGNPVRWTDPTGLCDDGSPACQGSEDPGWHLRVPCPTSGCKLNLSQLKPPVGTWFEEYVEPSGRHNLRVCSLVQEYQPGGLVLVKDCSAGSLGDGVAIGDSEVCALGHVFGGFGVACFNPVTGTLRDGGWHDAGPGGLGAFVQRGWKGCLAGLAVSGLVTNSNPETPFDPAEKVIGALVACVGGAIVENAIESQWP